MLLGQTATANYLKKSVEIDFESIVSTPKNMRSSITQTLVENNALLAEETAFTVSSIRYTQDWMFTTLVPKRVITSGWENFHSDDFLDMLGTYDPETGWITALQGTTAFDSLAKKAPKDFIDVSTHDSAFLTQSMEYLFPWSAPQKWYKTQGWHGNPANAIDLQPVLRTNPAVHFAVLAAERGRLEIACSDSQEINLRIIHPDGSNTVYAHLAANAYRADLIGKTIVRGQFLGQLYSTGSGVGGSYSTPCGSGTAAHLHFFVSSRNITLNGFSANDVANAQFATQYQSSNQRTDSSQPAYSGEFAGQNYQGTMVAGTTQRVQVQLRNTGTATWDGSTKILATPRDVASPFYDPSWLGTTRITSAGNVPPSAVGTFDFVLRAPTTPGEYRVEFGFVQEGTTWFPAPVDGAIWFPITVTAATPASPSNFRIADRNRDTLTLAWLDNATNEAGYRIYRWNGSTWPLHATLGPNVTSYTDQNLLCAQGYSYQLAAYNNAGETIINGWIDGFTTDCPSPPTTPANLQVNTTAADRLTLAWEDTSTDETGFNIYKWGFDGTNWDFFFAFSTGANTTSSTEVALDCERDYYYQVSASNEHGESARTNWVMGRTAGCIPPKPVNVRVAARTMHTVQLAWNDVADNESGFKIYRWGFGDNGWDFYYHDSVGTNEQSYWDGPSWMGDTLSCGASYYYLVSAYNTNGESERVGWVVATTEDCPPTPTATATIPGVSPTTTTTQPTATTTASPTAPMLPPTNTATTQPSATTTGMPLNPTVSAPPPTSTATAEPSATATTVPSPSLPEATATTTTQPESATVTATTTTQPEPATQYHTYLPMLQ